MWPSGAQVSPGWILDSGIAVPPAVSGENSAHLCQQLLFSDVFPVSWSSGCGQYHIHSVVLICISPVTDVAEYLFICLVAIENSPEVSVEINGYERTFFFSETGSHVAQASLQTY